MAAVDGPGDLRRRDRFPPTSTLHKQHVTPLMLVDISV